MAPVVVEGLWVVWVVNVVEATVVVPLVVVWKSVSGWRMRPPFVAITKVASTKKLRAMNLFISI